MALEKRTLDKIGRQAINLTESMSWGKSKEGWLHGVVLGLLEAKSGKMTTEHNVRHGRIDLRQGGSNPTVIELVVRSSSGNTLYASQNRKELRKLTQMPQSKAKRRFLLLLDLGWSEPISKATLKRSYDHVRIGRGRLSSKKGVRVMYVHKEKSKSYDFLWRP